MPDRIYLFLGLAAKAGKLVSGEEACEKALKSGKVELVLIASNASENTQKKMSDMCSFRSVKAKIFGEKGKLGKYIGKENRSAVAVLDHGFASRLTEMIENNESEMGGDINGKA